MCALVATAALGVAPPVLGQTERQVRTFHVNGAPPILERGQSEISYTFLLVADALALTMKSQNWVRRGDPQMSKRDAFTMVTDAFSVNGDLLTVHRQLTSVNGTVGLIRFGGRVR
jgi:hypothetical protein